MPDLPGFFTEMDRTGNWTPVPLRVSLAQPGGPVEESFFKDYLRRDRGRPEVGRCRSTRSSSPAMARRSPKAPTIPTATCSRCCAASSVPTCRSSSVFDLHANVSRRMTDNLSVFVGYLENPHIDIHERGVEAAKHMRECLAGARTAITMVKMPIVPPQIALLTAKGPYADLIKYGQTKVGGDILNVSVMAGFAYSDSPKNGLTAVVTARNGNREAAADLSLDIAQRAWGMKERFKRGDDVAGRRGRSSPSRSAATGGASRSSWPTSPTIPAAAGAATRPICCAR